MLGRELVIASLIEDKCCHELNNKTLIILML